MSKRPSATSACCALASLLSPRLFKALGDESRVHLLVRLIGRGGSANVGDLAAESEVDLSVVSRHLAQLRDAGIVESRRQGKNVEYRVCCGTLAATLRQLADLLDRCCPVGRSK